MKDTVLYLKKKKKKKEWGGSTDLNAILLTKPPSLNLQNVKQTEDSSTNLFCLFLVWFMLLLFVLF